MTKETKQVPTLGAFAPHATGKGEAPAHSKPLPASVVVPPGYQIP